MSEEFGLICLRRADHPIPPLTTALPRDCAGCGAGVWASPASLAELGPDDTIICIPCWLTECDGSEKYMPMSTAQLSEIRQAERTQNQN